MRITFISWDSFHPCRPHHHLCHGLQRQKQHTSHHRTQGRHIIARGCEINVDVRGQEVRDQYFRDRYEPSTRRHDPRSGARSHQRQSGISTQPALKPMSLRDNAFRFNREVSENSGNSPLVPRTRKRAPRSPTSWYTHRVGSTRHLFPIQCSPRSWRFTEPQSST